MLRVTVRYPAPRNQLHDEQSRQGQCKARLHKVYRSQGIPWSTAPHFRWFFNISRSDNQRKAPETPEWRYGQTLPQVTPPPNQTDTSGGGEQLLRRNIMLGLVQNWFGPRCNPIGVDFGSDCLRLAQ